MPLKLKDQLYVDINSNAIYNGTNKQNIQAKAGTIALTSDIPSVPTVNNGTLTIQKNGTNVQTFTANQSSNATANITVPTKTSDLTNDSGFITSSGTSAKADKLTTARTIALGTGATGTATSFDGSANITIPVTEFKEAYATWGGKNLSGNVSPNDAAIEPVIGGNKWAFATANSFAIDYSIDGGETWVDYGATDNDKRALTTTSASFYLGKNDKTDYSKNRLRITLNSNRAGGSAYISLRKLLIDLSTNGATGTQVTITSRTIGNYNNNVDTWTTVGTYNVAGWSGWNSIPYDVPFGGSQNQTGQIAQIRLTFKQTGGTANMGVWKIKVIGITNWQTPSTFASSGHLYSYDVDQNATFPANVKVTGSLQHGSYTYTLPNKTGTVAMTSDIPSVPTVNNGQLIIQKNGTNVATFTANQSGNATANITVPTKTSDLTNDSGFLSSVAWGDVTGKPTFATVATSGSYNDLSNKPTIPAAITVDSALSTTSTNPVQNKVITTELNNKANTSDMSTALAAKQDRLTAGAHINITGSTIKAVDYVHSEQPVSTTAVTPVVTNNMIADGTITADKLATGATVKLTLSTSDIGEGSALAANTLYGVYQ